MKQLTLDKKNGETELADAHDKIAQLQQEIENASAELQDTCKSVNLCSFVCSSCICLFFFTAASPGMEELRQERCLENCWVERVENLLRLPWRHLFRLGFVCQIQ